MRARRGYTLIELITSLVVLAILGTVTSMIMMECTDAYVTSSGRARLHGQLSITLDRVTRELRAIRPNSDVATLAPDFLKFESTSLSWMNQSGDVVACELNGSGELELTIDGEAGVLLENVSSVRFDPIGETDNLLDTPVSEDDQADIRRVRIDITVTHNGVTESLRTLVFLRSLMEGSEGGGG